MMKQPLKSESVSWAAQPGAPCDATDSIKPTFSAIWRRLGPAGPLAIVAASFPALGGFLLLGTLGWTAPWLQSQGNWGVAIYVMGFAVCAGLALLPTYAQAFLGGWVFKIALGIPAALAAIVCGAVLAYLIARRAAGERIVQLIAEQPKWQAVSDGLLKGSFLKRLGIITLLRLPPNSPFAMTNLVMAACKVRPDIYILGTLLGIAPRTALLVYIGATANTLNLRNTGPAWLKLIGIAVAIIVIIVIGAVGNRALTNFTQTQQSSEGKSA